MNTMIQTDCYTLLGFAGMLMIVIAYYNNQIGKMHTQSLRYSLLNFIGSVLLLISLLKHFNLGSFLIEIFWVAISLMGVIKYHQANKQKHPPQKESTHNHQSATENPEN